MEKDKAKLTSKISKQTIESIKNTPTFFRRKRNVIAAGVRMGVPTFFLFEYHKGQTNVRTTQKAGKSLNKPFDYCNDSTWLSPKMC